MCPIVIVLVLVELGYLFIFLVHDLERLFLHIVQNNDVVKSTCVNSLLTW